MALLTKQFQRHETSNGKEREKSHVQLIVAKSQTLMIFDLAKKNALS